MGNERRIGMGKAVIEHFLHITAGPCLTWENSKATVHKSFIKIGYILVILGHGKTLLREYAHPKPVTLPQIFLNASRIRCLGGVNLILL